MATRTHSLPPVPGPLHADVGSRAWTRATDTFGFAKALLVMLAAAALDVTNYLDKGTSPLPLPQEARYLLLVVPVVSMLWLRLSRPSPFVRRPAITDRVLFVLLIFGLTGTIYGILFRGTHATARPLFLPMLTAFLYLAILQDPTEGEVRRLLRAVAWIGLAYIVVSAVANSGLVPQLAEYRQFKNASFPFVALGLGAAFVLEHRFRLIVAVGLTGIIFLGYPSATSALILIGTILTVFMTNPRSTSFRPYLVAIAVITVGVLGLANLGRSVALTNDYFELVDKKNTSKGRLAFWANGLEEFRESPIIGSAFSSDTVTRVSARRISPYHNDFVYFMAKGGAVALLLLMGWIVLLERTIIRRYFVFVRAGDAVRAAFLRTMLIGFNAFFVSMMFNPVLQGLSRSATIFAMYGLTLAVARSAVVERPAAVAPWSASAAEAV